MPKIVELIGPSGVGKTAIYNEIRSLWQPEYNWVTFDDLGYKGRSINSNHFGIFLKKIKRFIFPMKNRERTKMRKEWKIIDYSNRAFLGDDYQDLKSGLMDLIEACCAKDYNGEDKRFNTIYMMMWSIAHLDKIQSAENDDRYCVLKQGEGLVSRIMHLNSPAFTEKTLADYMELIPIPDVIINLDVPIDEIMRRIKTRRRLSSLHRNMDEDTIQLYTKNTLKYLNMASDIAEQKGSRILKVDATQEISDSTTEIVKFLTNLDRN